MKAILKNNSFVRIGAAYIVVSILFVSLPLSTFAQVAISADIKANGSDGTVTITNGDSWNYSWTSTGAASCQIQAPDGVGTVPTSGNDGPIGPGHAWYPSTTTPTTLTLNCTDGVTSVSDTVVIQLGAGTTTPPPSGTVTADIKANGQDGTVTITNGNSWNYSWTSTGAASCQIQAPDGVGTVPTSGNDGPIGPGHAWYPSTTTPTTLTLNCTNGVVSASDSVIIQLIGATSTAAVTADIKANGSDGPVTITNGDSWNYSWTSTGAASCQIQAPDGVGTVPTSGNDGPIGPGHAWYPTLASSTTLTLNCTNGINTATDRVFILVVAPSTGGGGGGGVVGGGGGGGSPAPVTPGGTPRPPQIIPAINVCPFLTSYLRIGQANDPMQVAKLQAFLKVFEHFDYVTINGTFDTATDQAVKEFQTRYASEVLAPWGTNVPTGYVYITTLRMVNKIACGDNAPIPSLPRIHPPVIGKEGGKEMGGYSKEAAGTTATPYIPLVGVNVPPKGQVVVDNGQKDDNSRLALAAALTSWPSTPFDTVQCLYEFLLILIVLYIIGSVQESVLYKDNIENVRKKFITKWITISAGLALAILGAYLLKEYCLMLPLLISLVISLVWLATYSKHSSVRTRAKTWYKETQEKTASMPNQAGSRTVMATETKTS